MAVPVVERQRHERQRTARGATSLALSVLALAGWTASTFINAAAPHGSAAPSQRYRLRQAVALRAEALRDSEGVKLKDDAIPFDASDASSVESTHTAEFKKRPFGVESYMPAITGKGAMIRNMKLASRYPGDPQGQAFVAGVKERMAIKSINGQDVSTWEFWDIMDLLDDKILDNSAGKFQSGGQGAMGNQPADLPVKVEYVSFTALGTAPAPPVDGDASSASASADLPDGVRYVDTTDPRFADLPTDATLQEYKIPPAPPTYKPQVVEEIRAMVAQMPEPVGYTGPRYAGPSSINTAWLQQMIANFKAGQLLPKKDAYKMSLDLFDILVTEKTLGRVQIPEGKKVTVVGDLHGQLWDFDHMLSLAGFPSPDNTFVFNGDFVDRGPWSVEVMLTICAFKLQYPNNVFMNRGNHESEMANHFYGFFGELEVKYDKKLTELYAEIFRATPLCHVINSEVFVVHGGIPGPDPRVWWKGIDNQISFDGRQIQISLAEIEGLNRFMEPHPTENPMMVDFLWSDPKGKIGYGPSGRMSSGVYLYGPDISSNFMQYNGLKMTLRSHEVKAQGYRYDHEGQYPVITVFSAPNYVDKAGNLAAVAIMENRGGSLTKPEFLQYSAQPHPDVPSGAYAVGGPLHPAGPVAS